MCELGLLDRARLFVRLENKNKNVKNVKHKVTRHFTVDSGLLPSKSVLLEKCRLSGVEWDKFSFEGIPQIKDKIVMAIYICHKVWLTHPKIRLPNEIMNYFVKEISER